MLQEKDGIIRSYVAPDSSRNHTQAPDFCCIHDLCNKLPLFNFIILKTALYCGSHKLENMFPINIKFCIDGIMHNLQISAENKRIMELSIYVNYKPIIFIRFNLDSSEIRSLRMMSNRIRRDLVADDSIYK
jgi:hypothetical protein